MTQRPTYRWRLPFTIRLLCYLALAALVTLTYFHLRSVSGGGAVRLNTHSTSFLIPRNERMTASLAGEGYLATHTIHFPNADPFASVSYVSQIT